MRRLAGAARTQSLSRSSSPASDQGQTLKIRIEGAELGAALRAGLLDCEPQGLLKLGPAGEFTGLQL